MTVKYSEEELMAFLDYLSSKGLIGTSTANSRKVAASKILSALDAEEKGDLRNIDVDLTFTRFSNKYGKDFTPQSLTTYKSRFNSALNDFFKFQENPAGFRTGISSKKPSKDNGSVAKGSIKKNNVKFDGGISQGSPPPSHNVYVLQIPISEGRLIEIRNLPMDLTEADAKKIAAIITAHVA